MAYDPSSSGYTPSSSSDGSTSTRRFALAPKQVAALLLIVLALVFALENTESVGIRIIAGPKVSTPLWILGFAPLVLGLIAGLLLAHRGRRHK